MPTKRIPRSQLSPEELAAVRAKDREKYPTRREKQCAANRKSYAKHRTARLQRQKASLAKRRAKRRAWERAYNAAHPEQVLAKAGRYRATHRQAMCERTRDWRANNPEQSRARIKAYRINNPEKVRANERTRRARKKGAPVNDFTAAQWDALCKAVGYRCCYCGKKFPANDLTPDHLTPYAKKGSNTLHNILPCCRSCNCSKQARAVLKPVQPFLLLDDSAAD